MKPKKESLIYYSVAGRSMTGEYAIGHVAGYYSLWQITFRARAGVNHDKLLYSNLSRAEVPETALSKAQGIEYLHSHGIF